MRSWRLPRSFPVALLLLATLFLAVQLAYQAQDAVRRHRATAEGVLRDYARLAAVEYARRTSFLDYYGFAPALRPLRESVMAGSPLPEPAPIEVHESPGVTRPLRMVRYYFAVRLDGAPPARPAIETRGEAPPPAVAAWIADTLAAHVRDIYRSDWDHAAVFGGRGTDDRVLVYGLPPGGTGAPATAYGFEAAPEGVRYFLERAALMMPLLPAPLAAGRDSLVAVCLFDGRGREIFSTVPRWESPFAARDTADARLGGLVCAATLRPDAAEALVIGGLPRSRVRQLLVLLGLTGIVLAATLLQLRREQELARVRTDFVSGVSHELRTPLAQIRMFAETLLLGRVRSEAEARRSLEIIDQEALRLTHLVENVLHFSRAERRALQLAPEPTPLAPFVQGVADGFAPLAAVRDMRVRAELEPGIVAAVDPSAVKQMLLNLLDNAVKYGPAGQTITVATELAEQRVRLRVDDQGPGVALRDRDHVWERFWRRQRDAAGGTAGAGIGLALVRELAALHGGRAWVEDAPAGGASFVVELPRAWRAADGVAAGSAPAARAPEV